MFDKQLIYDFVIAQFFYNVIFEIPYGSKSDVGKVLSKSLFMDLAQQINSHLIRCQYPLINYPVLLVRPILQTPVMEVMNIILIIMYNKLNKVF